CCSSCSPASSRRWWASAARAPRCRWPSRCWAPQSSRSSGSRSAGPGKRASPSKHPRTRPFTLRTPARHRASRIRVFTGAMDSWSRTLRSALALGAVALLAACSAHGADGDASPPNTPAPLASEDPYRVVPEPGRTIEAAPPADAGDIAGWVVAVVVPNDDEATQTLRAAAREVGERAGARTLEFVADGGGA